MDLSRESLKFNVLAFDEFKIAAELIRDPDSRTDAIICSQLLDGMIADEDPAPAKTVILCKSDLVFHLISKVLGYRVRGKGAWREWDDDNPDHKVWIVIVSMSSSQTIDYFNNEFRVLPVIIS